MEEEPEIIHSPLSRKASRDGHTVSVEIYGTGKNDWILEVVDAGGNSTVWDGTFDTDNEAWDEFVRTIEEEGISSVSGPVH
jgi:hypothetical protein